MTYNQWFLLFTGAVLVMLIANLIQWAVHQERIYGQYTAYILLWMIGFGVDYVRLPPNVLAFIQTVSLHLFSLLYLEIALTFLPVNDRPGLPDWYRRVQWSVALVAIPEVYFNLFSSAWQTGWHEMQLNLIRILIILVTYLTIAYTVVVTIQKTDVLARFFVVGTLVLLISELLGILVIVQYGQAGMRAGLFSLPLPIHPGFIGQLGLLFDIACVSLGLSYRQRRETRRQMQAEQELLREREHSLRRQLEADLTLQQIKQQHTEAQMRALQSQVNPHFLFNALNTLSSLIDENPRQATDYVDELSSVYRYLLRSADQELTTLSVEMDFMESYFHLLKTRFGNSVCPEVAVANAYRDALIPPLTLQLLVENAVKHNRALPDEPLTIRIRTTAEGQLVVENNLQRRNVRVESNGVGLSNITDKYRLLHPANPDGSNLLIEEVNGWFRVKLPLLGAIKSVPRK
ncbi:histidine kinase [Larkinella knui]|uniref:Histidine kinase n=1 Tax=Larkinella knui TaxID=2025310 RepID=A0A3P1CYK4_9BACT|nr:histidine kinase [Larkinella knui]